MKTFVRLGIVNLFRVMSYRIRLRLNLHPVQRIKGSVPTGPFFKTSDKRPHDVLDASMLWSKERAIFSYHKRPISGPPSWRDNPFNGASAGSKQLDWFKIKDFEPKLGDIKTVWEASRFDWLLVMAQRAALGDHSELERMNRWLTDWISENPPYKGPNWKCGQEASIRVIYMVMAAHILDQRNSITIGLQKLISIHLCRIECTISYALGQANNHGTSEASALYLGGQILSKFNQKKAAKWEALGRFWLEDRAKTLIADDGTFSQYSTVYHRMLLDTYSIVENWRVKTSGHPFSKNLVERLSAATDWLESMVNFETGDVPNIGANDGTQLLKLSNAEYRDFRPSLQLASLLFRGVRAIKEEGIWDQPAHWFEIPSKLSTSKSPRSQILPDGGFHVLRNDSAMAVLNYPCFKFRPSQADALHLDFWVKNKNICRDAGTYSYNASAADTHYFNGTSAHNTVEFDGRDQMPRISRFLFGDWLSATHIEAEHTSDPFAGAAYSDKWGAKHHRKVTLKDSVLKVEDLISGFQNKAVLRWRLFPTEWTLIANNLSSSLAQISIYSSSRIEKIELVTGYESRYYLEKTTLPVLEVTFKEASQVTTEIRF